MMAPATTIRLLQATLVLHTRSPVCHATGDPPVHGRLRWANVGQRRGMGTGNGTGTRSSTGTTSSTGTRSSTRTFATDGANGQAQLGEQVLHTAVPHGINGGDQGGPYSRQHAIRLDVESA